nr:2-phospho-L-lactate transferase CofD family protein [Candidatus Kuenenia stuttgartiensis]
MSETEEQEQELYQLFQYRFNKGSLNGMSLGNLLMAALTDLTGSFDLAIKKASKILNIRGKVLPSTLNDTHICAELEDGAYVEEEFNVRAVGKSPIKRVFLKMKMSNHCRKPWKKFSTRTLLLSAQAVCTQAL